MPEATKFVMVLMCFGGEEGVGEKKSKHATIHCLLHDNHKRSNNVSMHWFIVAFFPLREGVGGVLFWVYCFHLPQTS